MNLVSRLKWETIHRKRWSRLEARGGSRRREEGEGKGVPLDRSQQASRDLQRGDGWRRKSQETQLIQELLLLLLLQR